MKIPVMAFEILPSEPVRRELRRLARKELGSARGQVLSHKPPSEEAIHTARKNVKKARALLRLIDAGGGHGLGHARRRLREVNRTLSCLRDATAMIETLAVLRTHHPDLFSEHGYARIRRRLEAGKRDAVTDAGRHAAWSQTARELRRLRKAARGWRTRRGGFRALAPGIRAICNRAGKALAKAKESNAAADFHAWRKEIKALWYALRLVGGGTTAIARDIRALRSTERWLGDDHNLVVLCAALAKDPTVCRGPLDFHRLQCAVNATQKALRRKSIDRTRAIMSKAPRDYVARVERAWHARRHARATSPRRRAA
jgi:CHAD domain-containing protein